MAVSEGHTDRVVNVFALVKVFFMWNLRQMRVLPGLICLIATLFSCSASADGFEFEESKTVEKTELAEVKLIREKDEVIRRRRSRRGENVGVVEDNRICPAFWVYSAPELNATVQSRNRHNGCGSHLVI